MRRGRRGERGKCEIGRDEVNKISSVCVRLGGECIERCS